MKLIAVISHKGGAGKTTSAVLLAEELARRGQRTLLVDADRQQGAGLLLGIDAPAGCVQKTMVGDLSYLGSARLTDLEIADCYASVASRFDVGVVDTPSLDDALARAWLRESAAALMVLQVDPLTVKTLPSALNTLEVVRAFKPSIQVLGLLPTMFDQNEDAHGRLLAELLSRRPEAVFTPVVPVDPALRHRANQEDCPKLGEAAHQAYQCAVDRILRVLDAAEPSVALPHNQTRVAPPWQQAPVQAPPAAAATAAAAPAGVQQPSVAAGNATAAQPQGPPAAPYQQPAMPGGVHAPAAAPPATGYAQTPTAPAGGAAYAEAAAPPAAPAHAAAEPAAQTLPSWDDEPEAALETLASPRVGARRADKGKRGGNQVPDWYQDTRVDEGGVVRKQESWLVRSRFAIACTIACLALIAAVVMGTMKRGPITAQRPGKSLAVDAAVAAIKDAAQNAKEKAKAKKTAAQKKERSASEATQTGKGKGTKP
jgi:chromosome partitioning protein